MAEATGRTPRVLVFLKQFLEEHPDQGLEDWVEEHTQFLLGEFRKFVKRAKDEDLFEEAVQFVNWFISPPSLDFPLSIGALPSPEIHAHQAGSFWDAGLVYRNADRKFVPTCEPAMKTILSFWASNIDLPRLSTIKVSSCPLTLAS